MMDLAKFLSKIPEEVKTKASRASDRWKDKGFISHSHELWGGRLADYAKTMPKGDARNKITEIANFISNNKALCYEDFYAYFWDHMNEQTTLAVLDCFKDKKGVLGRLEQMLRSRFPQIPEDKWHGLRT